MLSNDYKGKALRLEPSELKTQIQLPAAEAEQNSQSILIGQDRATQALAFGLGVDAPGYNVFVMGEPATGRYTLIKEFIEHHHQSSHGLYDVLYLNNFDDERQPQSLTLGKGESKGLIKDVSALVDEVLATFPNVFENPGYQRRKANIERQFENKYVSALESVQREAANHNIVIREEGNSISFSMVVDGKVLEDELVTQLPDAEKQAFFNHINELETLLTEALIELPSWQRENSDALKQLKRDVTEQAIRPLLKELQHKYASNLQLQRFFSAMKQHLVETIILHLDESEKEDNQDDIDLKSLFTETYVPNVLVSHNVDSSSPLVYEANPTYQSLFGKIEYTSVQGSVYTNYRMITPGALHKANGGYLVIDADKLLSHPQTWDALKLALKFSQIKIDVQQQEMGMVNSMTLEPEPIKLDVKILLLGSRSLYYALQDYDSEFPEMFRVLVDFDDEIPLNDENLSDFLSRLNYSAKSLGFESIDEQAKIQFVEYSLRMSEHQHMLSAKFASMLELLNEAAFFARQQQQTTITKDSVEQALKAKTQRTNRVPEQFLDDIQQGHVLISTDGEACGTLNGLTVLDVGDVSFGTPARITATVYAGASGIVDIEREVELGQSIHSKGVLLLSGYLGNKYAQSFPLTLSANIALEQSYGYIDGDSASLAELLALISALTDIPLSQGIAVTGSINQLGEVQAVGGINEKIEGFFELCHKRGLTGKQGVIIPKSNCINLMLKDEVIQAIESGAFHVFAIENVDDAIEIMTQKRAGTLSSQGRYPKKSVHSDAVQRLSSISDIVNGTHDE